MYFLFLELDSQPRPVESESHAVGPRNVHFKYTLPPTAGLMHVWEPWHRPSKYDSTSQMCGTSSLSVTVLGGRVERKMSALLPDERGFEGGKGGGM